MTASTIDLISPLSPDECEARLREATDREGPLGWFGARPVIGSVSLRSATLRKRIFLRNSFQTYLVCSLEHHVGGTRIRCETGMHFLVPVFLTVSCGFIGLFAVGVLVAAVRALFVGGGPPLYEAALPVLMLGFMFCLVRFGRWLAHGEAEFLIAFVTDVLAAKPGTASEPVASTTSR